MITVPTVLILGAGASVPYGFPCGQDLIQIILRPSDTIDKYAFGDCLDTEKAGMAAEQFRTALRQARVPSIDEFLFHRSAREVVFGKRLIAAHIASRESPDMLYPENGDWLRVLFDIMGRGATAETFADNALQVITFNYDRSFEMALALHLTHKYALTMLNAIQIASSNVYHVHGSLGGLKHSRNVSWNDGREYTPNLNGLSRDPPLRLFHEDDLEQSLPPKCIDALRSAKRVVTLGFAFHEMNCRRLFRARSYDASWRSSSLKMTPDECRLAKRWVFETLRSEADNSLGGITAEYVIRFGEPEWDAEMFLRENVEWLHD